MKYTIFWIPNEGVHPHATLETYAKIWPIMHESVRKLGHKLVHITDEDTPCWGDEVFRVPGLNAKHTMWSRDVAWLSYINSLDKNEQACMIEPDTVMVRDVPPIQEGFDMVLLRRPESVIPGWFKLAKKSASRFYQQVVENYERLPVEWRSFHGDIKALHMAAGLAENETAHTLPALAHGTRIEVRDWPCYGFRKPHAAQAHQVFLQYKGTSKKDMA
jgi:hypothetical protein